MASLIPGYEYDIFISYRQKDNKHDGWVTEFVDHLKGELESTFKEEVSVYFDINPHDGLLETHEVGDSLKEKLKCLIFIPIISRTYCDPKSFAWEHEFKAFVEQASQDQFGLKVKLPNGNVASRVLPVRIYDLDPADIKLCESVLGGVLRGVEFIYAESGVNRPLKLNDDEKTNLNKTKYINQINKVANAIKEVITAIEQDSPEQEEVLKEVFKPISAPRKNHKTTIIAGLAIALVLIVLGILFIPKLIMPNEQLEKSIAVLPFINDSPSDSTAYFINGIMEEILNNLQKIKSFSRVLSRTSTDQYRNKERPMVSEIAKKLGINYIVEGSGQKYGNKFRLSVQLIESGKKERHLWGDSYDREINSTSDILKIESEIAKTIAKELQAAITPEEKKIIEKIPTTNMEAYDLYMRAQNFRQDYTRTYNLNSYRKSVSLLEAAIGIDSTFAKAYSGLAEISIYRFLLYFDFNSANVDSCLLMADKALSLDNKLAEAYYVKGCFLMLRGEYKESLENLDNALVINPNYYNALFIKGYVFIYGLQDYVKGIEFYEKTLKFTFGDEHFAFGVSGRSGLMRNLGDSYLYSGFIDEAKKYYLQALDQDGDSVNYFRSMSWLELCCENIQNARQFSEMAARSVILDNGSIDWNSFAGDDQRAYYWAKKLVEQPDNAVNAWLRIGYAYWKMGKHKEAESFFNRTIKIYNESISHTGLFNKYQYYDLAGIYAFLGDKSKAYEYLDQFNTMNFYPLWIISYLKHDVLFNNIRGEERFQKILQNVEAKYHSEHERVRKWLEDQGML
jgi:TolB-like protein